MAYETAFFGFTWIEGWKDPKNSQSAYVTGLNKSGWRLIQVLEVRRTNFWLTESQVNSKAYVIDRVKYQPGSADHEKRARHYKGRNDWRVHYTNDDHDKKGFPVGNEIHLEFIMERPI